MSESIFIADGDRFVPTEHARGPWDPRALHGGAPAALITVGVRALCSPARAAHRASRLRVPATDPDGAADAVHAHRAARPPRAGAGRRAARRRRDWSCARARCACRRRGRRGAAAAGRRSRRARRQQSGGEATARPPARATTPRRASRSTARATRASPATAMEMRWLERPVAARPGPGVDAPAPSAAARRAAEPARRAWPRRPTSATASAPRCRSTLPVHQRRPDHPPAAPAAAASGSGSTRARCCTSGGAALAESVLHDEHGPLGRAFQTLVVQALALSRRHASAHATAQRSPSASSIAASVSASSTMPDAEAFACTCSGRLAPTIAEATFRWRSTHASASCGHRQPGLLGDRPQPLHGLEHRRRDQPVDEAAHALARGARVRPAAAGRAGTCR